MKEIISYVTLALCLTIVTSQSYNCPQGSVVYPLGTDEVYGINVTVSMCPAGQECRFYGWNNTDRNTSGKAYVETGFCAPPSVPHGCEWWKEQAEVGIVDDCMPIRCASNATTCEATFRSTICNLETVSYTEDKKIVIFNPKAGTGACKAGMTCGMFRWLNTESNFTSFVETGVCVDPEKLPTCQDLVESPEVTGVVSNCSFSSCQGDLCDDFEIPQPQNRGFRCDQGTFAFDMSRSKWYFAENVTSAPCARGDACGMFRFVNVDKDGNRSYVETGFCSPVENILYTSCETLKSFGVENAENCSVEFCSGDFCQEFSHLQAPEECPKRAHWDDIQILPGCTAKEALGKTFDCVGKFVGSIPFASNETEMCSNIVDNTISCLSNTLQECLAFENDGETPCPSELNFIEGIGPIFKIIKEAGAEVKSLQDIKTLITLFNVTMSEEDLNALDTICSNAANHSAILQGLMNATSSLMGVTLNIGPPVCSDAMIVDDLIKWSLEMAMELLKVTDHKGVCVSYDKLKVRMVDAVVNRCYNLDNVGALLAGQIGQYYSNLVQNGINIVKEFLFKLDVPGCSSVPFPSHRVCHQGIVAYSLDMQTVYEETNVTAAVCDLNMNCGMIRFVSTDNNNNTAYVESGFCDPPNYNVTCDVLKNETQIREYRNCSVESCSDDNRCLKFKTGQCKEAAEDDIAVLPKCSMKKTLNTTFECMGPFVAGYPFEDKEMCRTRLDGMTKCLAFAVTTCLSGDCPTILDFIPGLRTAYKDIAQAALKAHTLGDALQLLPGMSSEIVDVVYSLICHESGTPVPDFIKEFFEALEPIQFGEPLCTNDILDRLIHIGYNAATAIFEARTHEQVCMAFSTMKMQLSTTWKQQCDPTKLHEAFQNLFGGAMTELVPMLTKAIEIGSSFLEDLEIPNCMGGGNMTMLDCSRFYTMTSQCGMRQAWLCDYVSWKFHFLNVWLIRFNEYRSSNMMEPFPMPECPTVLSDMCVNQEMMRCATTSGCRMCFCEDHRYKDMNKVMMMWREDYAQWKKAMTQYSDISLATDQCGM